MACNYFSVIIFNMENFTNKNVRVKRRGLINLINFYRYYLIHSKQGWFSSCLFHFCIIMLLIFIYTVFNFFLCSDWSSCALLWDDELLVTMVVASLLASLVCFLPWFYPKNYNVWNFFGCSMYGNVFLICCFTKHRAPTVELRFFLSKNVTYVFFESAIASFYQALHCGSPRGTMDLWYGIWLTEFLHSFPCKFLSIIAMQGLWKSKHEKYILQCLYNLLACFGHQWDEPRIFLFREVSEEGS